MPVKYNYFADAAMQTYIPGVCIHGHFNFRRGFGIKHYYPEVDQFFTILRDPFERQISSYFYAKNHPDDFRFLRDFQDPRPRWCRWAADPTYDLQTFLTDDHADTKNNIFDYFPYTLTMENYQEYLDKYFVYIGIAEHLQETVNQLAMCLGFYSVPVPVENVSRRFEEVPTFAREQFIKDHPLEFAIYAYALERFNKFSTGGSSSDE
jgi:hypothetical protein